MDKAGKDQFATASEICADVRDPLFVQRGRSYRTYVGPGGRAKLGHFIEFASLEHDRCVSGHRAPSKEKDAQEAASEEEVRPRTAIADTCNPGPRFDSASELGFGGATAVGELSRYAR